MLFNRIGDGKAYELAVYIPGRHQALKTSEEHNQSYGNAEDCDREFGISCRNKGSAVFLDCEFPGFKASLKFRVIGKFRSALVDTDGA